MHSMAQNSSPAVPESSDSQPVHLSQSPLLPNIQQYTINQGSRQHFSSHHTLTICFTSCVPLSNNNITHSPLQYHFVKRHLPQSRRHLPPTKFVSAHSSRLSITQPLTTFKFVFSSLARSLSSNSNVHIHHTLYCFTQGGVGIIIV